MRLRRETRPVGEEPDPRFVLANERTFLAWNRTALALIGGGLAVGKLLSFDSSATRLVAAVPPIVLGALLAVTSRRRWARNDRALRLGEPLPTGGSVSLLAMSIGAMAVVAVVVVTADALAT
jgi:putative membrane protein